MIKQLGVVAACAIMGSACGLADIGSLGSESAEVEIVNAEGTGTGEGIDSEAPDQDTALGSGTVDDTEGDGGSDTESDSGETAAPLPAGEDGRIEVALAEDIFLVSEEARMSTNPDRPTSGWSFLAVDSAYSADKFDDEAPAAGSKYVIVDYQLLGVESSNLFESAFRLHTEGKAYSPSNNINAIVDAGQQVNSRLVFEVPASAQVLQLEGGVPAGAVDGFTTLFDITLSPLDIANPAMALPPQFADADIEATAQEIKLTSDDKVMSTNLDRPTNGSGELTVDAVTTTAKLEGEGAGPDHKFLIVEYQILGQESGNFFEHAFRIETDGERYGPANNINEIVNPGEVFNGSLIFVVPRHTSDYVLTGGSPAEWQDGFTTTYEFWVPEPGTGSAQPADADTETDNSSTDPVEVEAEASSITLTSADNQMSTNLDRPERGWGSLTIDAVRTTAKIEQDGAGPDHKFVVVDYQLLGGESGNFFEGAFRLEASGELYSPLNNLNEIVDPGEVFNGSLVFRVPRTASTLNLEAGVVEGSVDGFSTSYEFSFS